MPRERSLPSKELTGNGALQTVPAVAADFSTVNSWIKQISVANTTAGAITFLVKDKQSTPRTLVPTVSIPANTGVLFNYTDDCQFMSGGINWVASGVGLEASISGFMIG